MHDVNLLDLLLPEIGAFYIVDRGYLDFARLLRWHNTGTFFVIMAKSDNKFGRRFSHPIEMKNGVRCNQTAVLTGLNSSVAYPNMLR